jgi:hypothetical protein
MENHRRVSKLLESNSRFPRKYDAGIGPFD